MTLIFSLLGYLWLSTVFVMIGKAGATAAFNILFLYTSELYPTQVRNLGVGVCSAMARASGTMASYAGDSLVCYPFYLLN